MIEFSETKAVDHGTSPREAKRGDQKSPRLVASTQRRDSGSSRRRPADSIEGRRDLAALPFECAPLLGDRF